MTRLVDAKEAIAEYERRFRREDVGRLEVSGLYALFPSPSSPVEVAGDWYKDPWPNGERAGAYLVFNEQQELLYVGKASTLGARLSAWFGFDESGGCRIRHLYWSSRPTYILTVAVPREMSFEAPALEEYLIAALKPVDNTRGLRSD
jgi:hypothetical protein